MSNNVQETFQKTAFGELSVAQYTPVIQVTAQNGLNDKTEGIIANGGTVDAIDSEFMVSTGADPAGFAALLSRRAFMYRAGQGGMCRLTARFTQGVADSQQIAGFINGVDGFSFGYDGDTFGILRRHDGEDAIQELQVTTGAAGAENATITIDGIGYSVPLTNSSINQNAVEIANSLSAQVPNFSFTANQDIVTALSGLSQPLTIFAFSSATAVAAWTIINGGALAIQEWVYQADWNGDTADWLDPTKGNVYQIMFQYLGYGDIDFYIEEPETGLFVLVHKIKYANANIKPSVADPVMRIGYACNNIGNTSDIQIHGASMSAFNQGIVKITEPGRSKAVTKAAVPTTILTPIFTLRNRLVKGGNRNREEMFPVYMSVYTDAGKGSIIRVIKNGTLSDDQSFEYVNEQSSIAEFDTAASSVTGGEEVITDVVASGSVSKQELLTRNDFIFNGEQLTVAAFIPSGASGDFIITFSWQEDI